MQVPIPHQLGRDEARRRLRENGHKMADNFPGGMAQVETSWPSGVPVPARSSWRKCAGILR